MMSSSTTARNSSSLRIPKVISLTISIQYLGATASQKQELGNTASTYLMMLRALKSSTMGNSVIIQAMMTHVSGQAYDVGSYGNDIHEMMELAAIHQDFGLYAHNNQPVHHVLYVAKKAGCNSVADKYLRKVMNKLYTTNGWAGDEDNGEMASWYVLSALGIYSLEGRKMRSFWAVLQSSMQACSFQTTRLSR